MPVFNGAEHLSRICDLILRQTFQNLELIIINDGSTDSTETIAKTIQKKDARVRVFSQVNQGVSSARNFGIAKSSGEYLIFIDDDDEVPEDYVEIMLSHAQKHQKQLIVCPLLLGDKKVAIKRPLKEPKSKIEVVLKAILTNGAIYSPCNKIYSTSIIKEKKLLFQEGIKYGEDLIFNLEYIKYVEKILPVSNTYYKYRMTKESSSRAAAIDPSFRASMYTALKKFVKNQSNLKIKLLMFLIRTRWSASVIKNRLRRVNG